MAVPALSQHSVLTVCPGLDQEMSFSISSRELVNRALGPDDVLAEVAMRARFPG